MPQVLAHKGAATERSEDLELHTIMARRFAAAERKRYRTNREAAAVLEVSDGTMSKLLGGHEKAWKSFINLEAKLQKLGIDPVELANEGSEEFSDEARLAATLVDEMSPALRNLALGLLRLVPALDPRSVVAPQDAALLALLDGTSDVARDAIVEFIRFRRHKADRE